MSNIGNRDSRSSPLRPAAGRSSLFSTQSSSSLPLYGSSPPGAASAILQQRVASPVPSSSRSGFGLAARSASTGLRHQRGLSSEVTFSPQTSEWSIFGVDVPLHGLAALRVKLEASSTLDQGGEADLGTSSADTHELLSCRFGGDRWKVEVVRRQEDEDNAHLSLYLCCNLDDYPSGDVVIPTTIMACVRDPSNKRNMLWQTWEEHSFAHEKEFWECHTFPLPSVLLANPKVAAADAITLSIQLQSPMSGATPECQETRHVPRNLLAGLFRLLDDKQTGDVQFIAYERSLPQAAHERDLGSLPAASQTAPMYRKRTIYAHSALLRARSAYFDTVFGSDWQETEGGLKVVKITDFDFVSVYWLVHWLYTDDITFADDTTAGPHSNDELAVEGLLSVGPGYDWQRVGLGSESGSSVSTSGHSGGPEYSSPTQTVRSASALGHMRARTVPRSSASPSKSGVPDKKRTATSEPLGRISPVQSLGTTSPKASSRNDDPHAHPAVIGASASALQVYRVAHRYNLNDLGELAVEHIISNLTPHSAFPLLLAAQLYPVLYGAIKSYALDNYTEVRSSAEFKKCFQEVGAGTWGEQGGEVLFDFMASLTPL